MSGSSLESRVKSYLKKEGRVVLQNAIKDKMKYSPDDVARKYIDVLKGSISGNLSYENVTSAISGFTYDYVESDDGSCVIEINFSNDLQRPSLYPDGYPEGIHNLAALYDKGVGHTMNQVFGEWHGKTVGSRTNIDGAGFMDDAKQSFMTNYAKKYNVKSVEIGSDFYK